jgi:signal transduction histidine kinase
VSPVSGVVYPGGRLILLDTAIAFPDPSPAQPMKQLSHNRIAHSPAQLETVPRSHWRFLGEARTRILLWYLLLMSFFVVVSLPLMRQFVFAEVNARVREDLEEDKELFLRFLENDPEAREQLGIDSAKLSEKFVIPPTNQQQFKALVELYLSRRLLEDDSFLMAFVDGLFYRSSPKALPNDLQPGSDFIQPWTIATETLRGEQIVSNPDVGSILYLVEPITINGQQVGTFVVAHTTAGERREAVDALLIIFKVMMMMLVIALLLAWFAAGKVLAPLRMLATTAHAISDTDLTQRIPVKGRGEMAELANTFNDMMDRLETAFATQRNFINDAGHELRTPITIIRGHLEVMGDEPEEQQETLALVLDELERMSRFVEDLLLLAKAERPDFLQLETIDLTSFTEDLFAKATALADRNWHLESIAKGRLVGDRQRITEAVMNLAQNATQHTTITDSIFLGTTITRHQVSFFVRDTGEGVALEDQERIFERFARSTKSRRRSEGAGLGLSIVQAIVEAHGGQAYLRSQPGTGATFTLVFPLESLQERLTYEPNFDR